MTSGCSSLFRRTRAFVAVGSIAISLAACTEGGGLKPVPPYDPGAYTLGVDDQIRVITYGQDQLTSDFRVDSTGKVAFPLTDGLQAAGLTTTQFADEVRGALEHSRMLRDPKVSVEITAYRMVSVLGEVARPGQYPYQPGMTMLTAVASAGGFTYRSLESRAYVIRQEGEQSVVGKIMPQDYVKPGDVIKIYERHF